MAALGPFPPCPRLAVAVSGGADSLALALLAAGWVAARGGSVLALIVDHGLRPAAAAEAAQTAARLARRALPARILTLRDLAPGPALAERARAARYRALAEAAAEAGIAMLLLGHHAADQAETVLMRAARGSGPAGLAGMAAWRAERGLVLLRPLLGVSPARLREFLAGGGVGWVEDPSNRGPEALRARLRTLRADAAGDGPATLALLAAARARARARAAAEGEAAVWLARRVTLRPEGFAVLPAGPWPAGALAALFAALSGAAFSPPPAALGRLAAAPRPQTLGGLRLLAARGGFLLVREARALGPPVAALPGALWDRRFRLAAAAAPPEGLTLAALGRASAGLRRGQDLPAAVLHALPALWRRETLVAVPHLRYPSPEMCASLPMLLDPARPAAGAAHRG